MTHDPQEAIFCAALQGIVANPAFFGEQWQGRPDLAVAFARHCVREAFNNDPDRWAPDFHGEARIAAEREDER